MTSPPRRATLLAMLVRPDWLRRKYLFSAAVIAASVVLVVAPGESSRRTVVKPAASAPGPDLRGSFVVTTPNGPLRVVAVYDAWRPYEQPAIPPSR